MWECGEAMMLPYYIVYKQVYLTLSAFTNSRVNSYIAQIKWWLLMFYDGFTFDIPYT